MAKKRDSRMWLLLDPDRLADDVALLIERVAFGQIAPGPRTDNWRRLVYEGIHAQMKNTQNSCEMAEKAIIAHRAGLTTPLP